MTLRWKTILIVGFTLVGFFTALHFILGRILEKSFHELEEKSVHLNLNRLLKIYENDLQDLNMKSADWAVWNDTYQFIQNPNGKFIQSNLADPTFIDLRLNLMVFVDTQGRIIHAKAFDLPLKAERPFSEDWEKALKALPDFLKHSRVESLKSGFILVSEEPLLLSSRPIVTSERKGPIRGTVLFGRFLDETEIKKISELLGLPFFVHRFNDPNLPSEVNRAKNRFVRTSDRWIQPLNDQSISGYALLPDLHEHPALIFKIETPRTLYQQGKSILNLLTLSLFAVSLVFLGLILFLLERFVLTPLSQIQNDIRQMGTLRDLSERLPVKKRDEFGRLSESINTLMAALELSQLQRRENEQLFQNAFDQTSIGMALISTQGRFLKANQALCGMLGYSEEELMTIHFQDITHSEDLKKDAHEIFQILRAEISSYQIEKRYLRKEGSLIWGLLNVSVVCDGRGKPLYFLTQIQDMTEKRKAAGLAS